MCFHQQATPSSKPSEKSAASGGASETSKSAGKDSSHVDATWGSDGGLPDAAAQAFVRLAYVFAFHHCMFVTSYAVTATSACSTATWPRWFLRAAWGC